MLCKDLIYVDWQFTEVCDTWKKSNGTNRKGNLVCSEGYTSTEDGDLIYVSEG